MCVHHGIVQKSGNVFSYAHEQDSPCLSFRLPKLMKTLARASLSQGLGLRLDGIEFAAFVLPGCWHSLFITLSFFSQDHSSAWSFFEWTLLTETWLWSYVAELTFLHSIHPLAKEWRSHFLVSPPCLCHPFILL